jgi:hypothetical protein
VCATLRTSELKDVISIPQEFIVSEDMVTKMVE